MFKKALLMLSIFSIVLRLESSYQQQNLRYRGNNQIFLDYKDDGGEISGENLESNNVIPGHNSFNGIVVINQAENSNQQTDENFEYSDYVCPVGVCLGAYYFTGSVSLAVVTPMIISVATVCMYPQSME